MYDSPVVNGTWQHPTVDGTGDGIEFGVEFARGFFFGFRSVLVGVFFSGVFFGVAMPFRPLVVAVSALVVSCNPPKPLDPVRVDLRTLVADYRQLPDTAREAYTGRVIRITLAAGAYEVKDDGIHWHAVRPTVPPTCIFQCRAPLDNKYELEIEGICRGAVHDGVERGQGIRFVVTFSDCRVTAR